MSRETATALARWRAAERELEQIGEGPDRVVVARRVVSAWLDYQVSTGGFGADEVVLVVDDDRRYVAHSANAPTVLGRPTLDGLTIADIAAPRMAGGVADAWSAFIEAGEAAGPYEIARPDGVVVQFTFVATANWPMAGFHVSRLTHGHLADVTTTRRPAKSQPVWSARTADLLAQSRRLSARTRASMDAARRAIRSSRAARNRRTGG